MLKKTRGVIGKFANMVSLPPKVVFKLDPISHMPADKTIASLSRTVVSLPSNKNIIKCTEVEYTKDEVEALNDYNDVLLAGHAFVMANPNNDEILRQYNILEES
tara:strand:- start:237 stop:548 length:312 start_codon:yes stop_codon:yes gene_type:complete